MSDGDADETDGKKRQSDAQRSSRFREIAARLDDEEDESDSAAETAVPGHVADQSDEDEHRDQTATDVDVELSRRGDRGSNESDSTTADSWEWVGDEDEATETDAEQSTTTCRESTPNNETAESSQPGQPEDAPEYSHEGAPEGDKISGEPRRERGADATPATTGETETGSQSDPPTESTTDTETSDAESAPDNSESPTGKRRHSGGRIWDSEPASTTGTADESAPQSDPAGGIDAAPTNAGEFSDAATESPSESLPTGIDLTPGTAVLVQSGAQDERTEATCHSLLYDDLDHPQPSVLLVRYQQMPVEDLRDIAAEATRTKLVSIGYAQDVPAPLRDAVETVTINNPNDITRLGIVVSGTIDQWSGTDGNISVCYDSLNVLLNYKDVKSTFRFLHVLLKTLRRGDAVAHFHVDPLAGDPQSINTLKPLFDEIVSIDSMGVSLE